VEVLQYISYTVEAINPYKIKNPKINMDFPGPACQNEIPGLSQISTTHTNPDYCS